MPTSFTIEQFLIECWKAVELYNAGKIDSKPWEQLEILKDYISPESHGEKNVQGMRNIISALKKMFSGDVYDELYFLKNRLSTAGTNKNLRSFRLAMISLVYARLGERDKSFTAGDESRTESPTDEPCYSIRYLARTIRWLHFATSYNLGDFQKGFSYAITAAKYLDPLFPSTKIINYPYPMSWIAHSLMRTMAVGYHLDSAADKSLLTNAYAQFLEGRQVTIAGENFQGKTFAPDDIIATDIGTAQQAASAAYFVTCNKNNINILNTMEQLNTTRLKFINERSELPTSVQPENKRSLFYILRRWNSFTPIVPNEDVGNRHRIYRGGGYFIWHKDKGTIVDPGFRFIRNFSDVGGRVADIDNIVITHAHNDHTADLESLFTCLYQHNATIKDKLKEFSAYLTDLQVAYAKFKADSPSGTTPGDFFTKLKSGSAEPGNAGTKNDWADLKQLLKDNKMEPGASVSGMDALDQSIIAMCLPKDGGDLTLAPTKEIEPKSAEKILEGLGIAKKSVQIYANLGTMKKFNAIIDPDSQYIDYIGGVHVIEPKKDYSLGEDLTMKVHKAYHNEVVTKNYATGLEFVFTGLPGNKTRRVLVTSDTSLAWKYTPNKTTGIETEVDYTGRKNLQYTESEVINDYLGNSINPGYFQSTEGPDLLLAHIGSIKDYEVSPKSFNPKDFIYKNHLGIIGTTQTIFRTKPIVALITEFGEEMTSTIKQSVDMVTRGIQSMNILSPMPPLARALGKKSNKLKILPADIGLVYDVKKNEYFSIVTWDPQGNPTYQANVLNGGGIDPFELDAVYTGNTFPVTYKQEGT